MSAAAVFWRAELARKALHLMSGAVPVAWGSGLVTAADVRLTLALALAVALSVEIARSRVPPVKAAFERLVGGLLRSHERRALTGATWLALAMLLAVAMFPPRAAIVALWAGAVGDAAAALVGRGVQRERLPHDVRKTAPGSLACALATATGAWWLVDASVVAAGVIGLAAAAAERPRLRLDDNMRVTLVAGLAAWSLFGA